MFKFSGAEPTVGKARAGVINSQPKKKSLTGDIRVIEASRRITFLESCARYDIPTSLTKDIENDLYFAIVRPEAGGSIQATDSNGESKEIQAPILILMDSSVEGREAYLKVPKEGSIHNCPYAGILLNFYGNRVGKMVIPVKNQDGTLKYDPITNKPVTQEVEANQNLLLNIKECVSLYDEENGQTLKNCWVLELVAHEDPKPNRHTKTKVSA